MAKKLHDAFYMKTKNSGTGQSLLMLILTVHRLYLYIIYMFLNVSSDSVYNTYAAVKYIIHGPHW